MSLQNKIDFALIFSVNNANPNGDPLNGNRPRTDYDGFGEVTDVCEKRKIRDRLMESGENIFVQSDDNKNDDHPNLRSRAEAILGKMDNTKDVKKKACATWFDVRAFGQVFPFKAKKKSKDEDTGEEGDHGVSIAIRGPVTIQSAFSVEPVASNIISTQIVKSTSLEGDGINRQSDQMGMKHRVDKGIYVAFGAMTPQLAERTGFSDEDAEKIKKILPKLFEGDASSARPEGSMAVVKVIWWRHNSKAGQYSSAKVHQTLRKHINEKKSLEKSELEKSCSLGELKPEIIDGF